MLVPGTLQELFSQGWYRPCCFPGHGGSCEPGGAIGYVGSQGMTGAVDLGLPPAMLNHGAWRELWAQGCQAAMLVPGVCLELWAPGQRVAMLVPGA